MSFLNKIFKDFVGPINSIPTNNWNSLFKNNSISDYLPYSIYDDEDELYTNNDDTQSISFELLTPHLRSGNDTALAMGEILEKMPEDVFVSVMYYGSKNIKYLIEKYRGEHKKRGLISEDGKDIDKSIDMICDYMINKTNTSCSSQMKSKIKDVRIICSIVFPKDFDPQELKKFKNETYNILHSNKFNPRALDNKDLLELVFELMNPDVPVDDFPFYDKTKFLNKQMVSKNTKFIVDDDYVNINDKKFWVNSTLQSVSEKVHIFEFGQKLGDYVTENLNSHQFNDSFIINATIKKKPPKDSSKVTYAHSFNNSQNWGQMFRKFEARKKESVEILNKVQEKQIPLFEYDLDVLVSGDSYKDALLNQQTIETYWNKSNRDTVTKLKLEKTKGIHHLAFLSSFPMAMNSEYFYNIGGKFRSLFANQASHLFPLESDSKGDGHNLLLTTRRGGLAAIDLFSSNANYNGYLVATSGAGKSVFLNLLGYNSYARGDKVFVLDYDNSFTGLVEFVNGQYLNLDPNDNAISFNPFSDIKSLEELKDELPYLSSFIYLLGCSKSSKRAEEDEKLITNTIQKVILKLYEKLGNKLEITDIKNTLFKDYGTDLRFSDFSIQLEIYCHGGIYEDWFKGPCEFSMQKDMMAVEFKGVENHPELRDPLVMLLLYHIGKVMYSTDTEKPRVQIILDEAHRFLGKNPRMDDFIEQAYRRARKFEGSMILATQGFSDIYDSQGGLSKAGSTIIANSSWKFFMKQQDTSTNLLLKSEIFSFDDTDKKIIRKIKTQKREYSEIFAINSDDVKMPLRLLMPTFFYYLTTTDGTDKKLIKSYEKKYNISRMDAIKMIVEEQENNAA